MGLTAIRGIAKARWLILVAVAILAIYVVDRLSEYQGDNAFTHEAVATITFREDATLGFDRGEFEGTLNDQFILADDVNSDILSESAGSFLPWRVAEIDLVLDENLIMFTGRGFSQEDADQIVQTMQDQYLAMSTVASGSASLEQEIADITAQIALLAQREIDRQAAPPLTPEEVFIESKRAGLETQIGSLQSLYGSLGVELLNPIPPRSTDDVTADIETTLNEMVRLQLELLALPPSPTAVTQVDEQALVDSLRVAQLEARWQELSTQLQNIQGLATASPVVVQPVTETEGTGRTNQLLALVGAVVVTLMALVGIEKTRGSVWSSADVDLEIPVLAELPPRGARSLSQPPDGDPWYITVPGGRRKSAIQLIRSQLDAFKNTVVAFQGSGVFDADTLDLTADVAISAAISGRTVLLIDATFSGARGRPEFGDGSAPSLNSILEDISTDPQAAMTEIKSLLLSQPETFSDLRVLRSEVGEFDSSDSLAGQRFEMLLEVARENFDLVLVAGAGFGNPTAYTIAQRVDLVVLVGSIGHTVDKEIDAAARDFKSIRASLLGIVLVRRRRSRTRRWLSPRLHAVFGGVFRVFRPISDKLRSVFTKEYDESPAGMSGFEGSLTRFHVTGESLENLRDPERDE